jgi:hypothetical protein
MLEQQAVVYVTMAALLALALGVWAAVLMLYRLLAIAQRVANPSPAGQIARLAAQDTVNRQLLETEDGRGSLLKLLISEAAIMGYLEDSEAQLRAAPDPGTADKVAAEIPKQEKKSVAARAWDAIKRNTGAIADKVFDKAYDLVKTLIPGADKK